MGQWEILEPLVVRVLTAAQDQLELQAPQDQQDHKDNLEQVDQLVRLELPGPLEHQDPQVLKDRQEHRERREDRERQGVLVLVERRVLRELQDQLVLREQ